MAGDPMAGTREPAVVTRSSRTLSAAVLATLLAACSFTSSNPDTSAETPTPTADPLSDVTDIHPSGAESNRPNLVLIMTDDMRADELRWMPRTRHFFADKGVDFVNAFASHPVCCPARASTLTGQYTHNHGVYTAHDPWGFQSLDDSETLPVWLQRSGYNSLFLGKYLNGYGEQPAPDGSSAHSTTYVPPGWSDWRGAPQGGMAPDDPMAGGTYRYFDMTLNVNGTLVPNSRRYSTSVLGNQSIDMIHDWAPKKKPFFLYANYVAPHHGSPTEADDPPPLAAGNGSTIRIGTPAVPQRVWNRYNGIITPQQLRQGGEADVSDKPEFIRKRPALNSKHWGAIAELARQRAQSLSLVDHQVARTIRALRATGELDNTIIAFTSDNGYFLGEHRMGQGKLLPYQPSLRVPMLIRGPTIPHGKVRHDPFLLIDLAPTFLDAANAQAGLPIDGESMLPVARNGDRGWRRPVLTESGPRSRAITTVNGDPKSAVLPTGRHDPRYSVGIRTSRYLYVHNASEENELYDLVRDPGELTNRIDMPAYRDQQRMLAGVLKRTRDCVGAQCRAPLPPKLITRQWGPSPSGPARPGQSGPGQAPDQPGSGHSPSGQSPGGQSPPGR